jgi:hypothetical protein
LHVNAWINEQILEKSIFLPGKNDFVIAADIGRESNYSNLLPPALEVKSLKITIFYSVLNFSLLTSPGVTHRLVAGGSKSFLMRTF